MRRNQITITISRYNQEVPKGYPKQQQTIHIYSDSNNCFEALSKAYAKAINVLEEYQTVASRTDIISNAEGQMLSNVLDGIKYVEDYHYQNCLEKRLEMLRDILFYSENANEILDTIKQADSKEKARELLKEKWNFSDEQLSSVFRLRFDMFAQGKIIEIKKEIEELERDLND